MNYLDFYNNAQRRLTEALLSMWASGQESNQKYFKQLLEEEPLVAEPVFQATFPWESTTKSFGEHTDVLEKEFIASLDGIPDKDNKGNRIENFRFPIDLHPYIHQSNSWKSLLIDKKSIVVTSGTGSGKTECFMIPVLQDLLKQKKAGHDTGVQAIFLYPLNALMNSQQKRIKAWCEAVSPQINFAIYNGNTEEDKIPQQKQREAYPELITRRAIRETPPQILFSNPTMLEYMLVRKKDQEILRKSQGKLRWILLDETHTYSGSAAAELAMQIRRILDAFGVTVDQVQFAATSATIGSDSEKELKQFIAQLTGKTEGDINVIGGKRVLPTIVDSNALQNVVNNLKKDSHIKKDLSINDIVKLRIDLNNSPALSATEIGNRFINDATSEQGLAIIDVLSNKINGLIETDKADAILPTRAHYFIRSLGGIFVCTNPNCERHKSFRPLIGSMTTYMRTDCEKCHAPLLELSSCNSCGNHLLVIEKESGNFPAKFRLPMKTKEDLFELIEQENNEDDSTEDLEKNLNTDDWRVMVLAKGFDNESIEPSKSAELFLYGIDTINATIVANGDFAECVHIKDRNNLCPHCGNRTDKNKYFRTSSIFLSRILSSSLLEQAEPMSDNLTGKLWGGRKYITFTDNRQGTAKSALAQNADIERNWLRTAVFHYLSNKKREGVAFPRKLDENEQIEYNQLLPLKGNGLDVVDKRIKQLESISLDLENQTIPNPTISIDKLYNSLINDADLISLHQQIQLNVTNGKQYYLKALLIDQFGKRPRKGNSPETMGFIKVIYPKLNDCTCPPIFIQLGWSADDWRDYLKVCLDFFVRYNTYFILPDDIRPYITQEYYSDDLYQADCNLRNQRTGKLVKRWPSIQTLNDGTPKEDQNRLILLLCAAMNITDINQIDKSNGDKINKILKTAWGQLTSNILTKTNTQDNEFVGYKLNLFERVELELLEKAWLCPVTYVPMDTTFRGYSPMIKGNINKVNFERYKVKEEINYPYFPFAYKEGKDYDSIDKKITNKEITDWSNEKLNRQKALGLWSNLHERILLQYPIYLAAEHSAQQNKARLQQIEEQFNTGKINILSCSTTMEMGVDIGGVSEVVMNNVPPQPANYLQRAGRAGRRSESKALAITFCAPNPIGTNLMNEPKWAMTHSTSMPQVKLISGNLIQRHINSFLLATYITSIIEGVDVKSKVGDFFYPEEAIHLFTYDLFKIYLNGLLDDENEKLISRYKKLVYNTIKYLVSLKQSIVACLNSLEVVFLRLNDRIELLNISEKSLRNQNGYDDKSPEIRAIYYQRKQLLDQNFLGYFAENDFIPSAGIPTGIVDFNTNMFANKNDTTEGGSESNFYKSNPSAQITRALSEYAPGNQVVLNGFCYDAAGIIMKSEWNDTKRLVLQNCPACGYSILGNVMLNHCPKCQHPVMQGIQKVEENFTIVIEPAGYSVDYYGKLNRAIKVNAGQSIIEPILLNMAPWNDGDKMAKIEMRTANSESEILYYNKGNGYGFAICTHCGRASREKGTNENPLLNHKRLNGGRKKGDEIICTGNASGIKHNVLLGGRLHTDFVEIRFRDKNNILLNDADTIWSLGVILSRKLAERLGVNSQEISFNVKKYHGYSSIFIFDTAKGGAGYSDQFIDYFEQVLDEAFLALDKCKCQKACTFCLIDRDSQWYLNNLNRNKALKWLDMERNLRVEIPSKLKHIFPNEDIQCITSNFSIEVIRVLSNKELKKITFIISNNIKEWSPDDWCYKENVTRLKLQGKDVAFALYKPNLENLNARELATVIEAKGQFQYKIITTIPTDNFHSLMEVEYADGKKQHYFSETKVTDFSDIWGQVEGAIYKVSQIELKYEPWNINLSSYLSDNKMAFEFKIRDKNTTLYNLHKLILGSEADKWKKIENQIKNKNVKITYQDIYLKDALGSLMILNLIKSFSNKFAFDIQSIQFNLSAYRNNYQNYSNKLELIDKDWSDSTLRTEFLKEASNEILDIDPIVKEDGFLPHWRELVFTSNDFELIIRPNGGIKNGWRLQEYVNTDDLKYTDNIKLFNLSQKDGILYNIVFEKKM